MNWKDGSVACAVSEYMILLNDQTFTTVPREMYSDICHFFKSYAQNAPLYAHMALMPPKHNPCDSQTVEKYLTDEIKQNVHYQRWLKLLALQEMG